VGKQPLGFKDSGLLGCDIVTLGKQISKIRRNVMPSFLGVQGTTGHLKMEAILYLVQSTIHEAVRYAVLYTEM
jgi:hypothetical protein